MEITTEDLLIDLGITPNLMGFDYICKMIRLIQNDNEKRLSICRMYEQVAQETGSTATRVERDIRHALSRMKKDSIEYEKYVGIKHITNSAVLYTLAYRLGRTIDGSNN